MPTPTLQDLARAVATLHDHLDRASYYDLLGLRAFADYVTVREAFHGRAQSYHPDRFVCLDDSAVHDMAYTVYKRITEAYNVLVDPELRRRYDSGLRTGQLRLPPAERNRRLGVNERALSNPFARIFLRAAEDKLRQGDLKGAGIDVSLGLSLEDAQPLRTLRDQILRAQARQVEPLERMS